MEDLLTHENEDRLQVLISVAGVEQLLGVLKLSAGTHAAHASAVVQYLEEFGLADEVAAVCLDATASNTGFLSVSCSLMGDDERPKVIYSINM